MNGDDTPRKINKTNFDEHKRAFWSVEFILLPVERLEVLVAEYGTCLGTDFLSTAPASTQTLASTHTTFAPL